MQLRVFVSLLMLMALMTACGKPSKSNDSPVDSSATAADSLAHLSDYQDGPSDTAQIDFAFANTKGNALLSVETEGLAAPEQFTNAIANGGERFDIQFERKKSATDKDNGRQTHYNFEECGGYLYKVKSDSIGSDHSIVLVNDRFLAEHTQLATSDVEAQSLSKPLRARVEAAKGRKIKQFQALKQINNGGSIYLFVFAKKGDSALASLAFVDEERIVFQDFPALYDETSTWRVDDGGQFGMDDLQILAVFENLDKIELVIDWIGAESYAIDYLQEDGTNFKSVRNAGRYCAPN